MLSRAFAAALILPILFAAPAIAQTAGGLNPLQLIATYESSGGTNAGATELPNSSATGIYQDISGTWSQALQLCGCGTTAQFPTAMSAPASVQTAANAALYNANGFSAWTCAGCNPALTAALAANGGASAYQTQVSTNPADYASLDTTGGLAAYMAGSGPALDGSGITVSATGITGAGVVPTSAVTGGSATTTGSTTQQTTPFSDAWATYITGISQQLQAVLGDVQAMVATPLSSILILGIAVLGIQTMFGTASMSTFMAWLLRGAFIVAMVGTAGSGLYQSYVVGPIMSIPQWFTSSINVGAASTTSTNVAGILDVIYNASQAQLQLILNGLSVSPSTWGDAMAASLLAVLVLCVLAAIWLLFAVVQLCLTILIAIGPLVLLAFLFDPLRRYVWGWIDTIVTLLLQYLVLAIMLAFFSPVIQKLESAFTPGAAPASDIRVFGALFLQLVIFAIGSGYLVHIVSRITSGWAPALSINRVISAAVVMASTAGRGASTAAQGTVAVAQRAIRGGAPVGRSLT
jgi:hypothetical protein